MREVNPKVKAFILAVLYPFIYIGAQFLVEFSYIFSCMFNEMALHGPAADPAAYAALIETVQTRTYENIHLIMICSAVITVVAALIVARKQGGVQTVALHTRLSAPHLLLAALACGAGMNILTGILMEVAPVPQALEESYLELVGESIFSGSVWMQTLSSVLFIPIAEEIIFRGLIAKTLRKAFSFGVTLVFQAVLFTLIHMHPYQMLYVFPMALLLGLLFLWSDNLLVPIMTHMAYNGLSVFLTAAAPEGDGGYSAMAVCLLLLVGVAGFVYMYRNRLRPPLLAKNRGRGGDL
ncbi:CPBP family intramembrane metalloprotease [Oscillospiraceae bacterium OttesenSCG-928-F05]|nr:CPBP family intramembrane metalloprotease [Oscillospiraceae bacterium OttesenSCG-928-F05]